MQSADRIIPIYGLELPDWVSDFCSTNGGISLSPINQSQLLELCKQSLVKHLIVYEQFVIEHTEILMNLLQQQRVESLTIYNNHPFFFTDLLLDRLNSIATTTKINIIVNGHYNNVYNNIKIYSIDTWEHSISHNFVLLRPSYCTKNVSLQKCFPFKQCPKTILEKLWEPIYESRHCGQTFFHYR